MRPVSKGDWPQDGNNNIVYNDYSEARPELIDRIGDYCSYCENQITNPAIEHILPKTVVPGAALNWYNFLLGCVNCNSEKGSGYINVADYYWPDVHNTYLLFDFLPMGIVRIKPALTKEMKQKAQASTALVGLENYGTSASEKDRRWINGVKLMAKQSML